MNRSAPIHFKTRDNTDLNTELKNIRHLEIKKDIHNNQIVILHLKNTGKEFMLDYSEPENYRSLSFLMHQIGY